MPASGTTTVELLRRAVVEAYGSASQDAFHSYYQGRNDDSADIKEAAKKLGHPTPPAPVKKPPQPTGIKPRVFLLSALVLVVSIAPVLGLFLPIYISAGNSRDKEASKRELACVVFPTPADVLAAGQQPMTPTKQTIVNKYLTQLSGNCSQVNACSCPRQCCFFLPAHGMPWPSRRTSYKVPPAMAFTQEAHNGGPMKHASKEGSSAVLTPERPN